MLATQSNDKGLERRFVIRPNRSMSLSGNLIFVALIAVVLGGIAVLFALAGFWMVVPFAGLELLIIVLAVLSVSRKGLITEVVDVTRRAVTISVSGRRPQTKTQLPRRQSRVVLDPSPLRWHPSRLFIAARDLRVEVGGCLREDERRGLASALREAIHAPAGATG